jgi:hypothetical protein
MKKTIDACISVLVAWVFAGIPVTLLFTAVAVNSVLIYLHVRNTIRNERDRPFSALSRAEDKRVKKVALQAFPYVAAILSSQLWIVVLKTLECLDAVKAKDLDRIFSLVIILTFNMLLYIRPMYMRARKDFPLESRFWHFRRALFGINVRRSVIIFQIQIQCNG